MFRQDQLKSKKNIKKVHNTWIDLTTKPAPLKK